MCLVLFFINQTACNVGEDLDLAVRPTSTPTVVPAQFVTALATITAAETSTASSTPDATVTPTASPIPTNAPNVTTPTDMAPNTAIPSSTPGVAPSTAKVPNTATPTVAFLPSIEPPPTASPTAAPAPPPPAGRIAFPLDDGGGYYDVWVVELPAGDPFLVQARARQPNFSSEGNLLVKADGNPLGESIGLLDRNYTWLGIINESPEDSYPFWHPDGTRYTYSNANLLKDPDTAHLAPYIFTTCSVQIPRFENTVECQDYRQWGNIAIGDAPVWTESDRLAFFSYKGDDGIYVVDNASARRAGDGLGPPRLLIPSNGRPTDTAGERVFFSAGNIDGNWEAYAVSLDGTSLTNLSNSPTSQDGLPTVSPDGGWVAFVSDRNGWGIWVVPLSGGDPVQVADLSNINPNLSPWGRERRDWTLERISWGP